MEAKGSYYQYNLTLYDGKGMMCKQVHGGHHGNRKMHPFGKNGEHRKLFEWNDDGTPKKVYKNEELTITERKECKNIL